MTRSDVIFKFNNSSTGLFKDQLFNEIEAVDQREQVEDLAGNTLFFQDDADKYIRQGGASGTDAYSVTVSSPYSILYGNYFLYVISFENTSTGPCTINVNGAGVKKIYVNPTTQANADDIQANNAYMLRYHASLDGGAGGLLIISGVGTGATTTEDSVEAVVDSTGGTITLDFESTKAGNFSASTVINVTREVVLANATRAQKYDFNFEVGTVGIPIDFGPNAQSTHALFSGGVFTPQDEGLHLAHAVRRYGTDTWLITFSGVYSVGDALPEPPDPGDGWVIGSGIWNDTAIWKDTGIWRDSP